MSEERRVTSNIKLEGASIICKNFRGKKRDFNNEGNRNFGVLLDDDLAEDLERDGWNVKFLKPRPDDPEQVKQPWLPVKVKFGNIPPNIVLIDSRGKSQLDEESVDQLDWTIIQNADVVIRPYNYPAIKGRPAGVSAYLKALYVTVAEKHFAEDDFAEKYFAEKYSNIPDRMTNREEDYGD